MSDLIRSEAPEDEQRHGMTVCATCYYAPSDARHRPWWDWMCQHEKAKLPPWPNPVTGQNIPDPPRLKCRDRNKGACADWRESINVFGIKVPTKESTP